MFIVGDIVLYGNDGVCSIQEKVIKKIGGIDHEYFVLKPCNKEGMTIFVPLDNEKAYAKLREVLSKDEIQELIETMPDNDMIWIEDANIRKKKYGEIIASGDHLEIVKLIKTLYINKEKQENEGKKFHVQDKNFLMMAETMINDEFSVVLDISPEEVLPYIINSIESCKERG